MSHSRNGAAWGFGRPSGRFPVRWLVCQPQRRACPVYGRISRAMRAVLWRVHRKHEKNTRLDSKGLRITRNEVQVPINHLAHCGFTGRRKETRGNACAATTRGESGVKNSAARAVSRQLPSASSIPRKIPFRINVLARAAHERQRPERAWRGIRAEGPDSRKSTEGRRLASPVRMSHRYTTDTRRRIDRYTTDTRGSGFRRLADHRRGLAWHRAALAKHGQTRLGTDRLTRLRSLSTASEASPLAHLAGRSTRPQPDVAGRGEAVVVWPEPCGTGFALSGGALPSIRGTSQGIRAWRPAGTWGRLCPLTCVGSCAGFAAVADALVTGLVSVHRPGCLNALSSEPTTELCRGEIMGERIGASGIEAGRATGETRSRRCRAQRDGRRVVGAVQDRVRAVGDFVPAMSGRTLGTCEKPAAGIRRRSCPRTRVGQCAGVGAVAGARVTGVVRMHARGCWARCRRSRRQAHWHAWLLAWPGDRKRGDCRIRGRREHRGQGAIEGRRGDRRSRSGRRRDIGRSKAGPGKAAGRCGRAAAKPREDRESVRTMAVCG